MKEGRYHDGLLMSQRVATEDKDFSGFPTGPENSMRHDCDNAARARRLCKLSYGPFHGSAACPAATSGSGWKSVVSAMARITRHQTSC